MLSILNFNVVMSEIELCKCLWKYCGKCLKSVLIDEVVVQFRNRVVISERRDFG